MSVPNTETLATPFSLGVFRILAVGAAVCIATVHFTQPFLHVLAAAFQLTKSEVSWVPTITLLGYACGIFFLIPLGDIISVRKLILIKLTFLAMALLANSEPILLRRSDASHVPTYDRKFVAYCAYDRRSVLTRTARPPPRMRLHRSSLSLQSSKPSDN